VANKAEMMVMGVGREIPLRYSTQTRRIAVMKAPLTLKPDLELRSKLLDYYMENSTSQELSD
jgi:hypothetical protein